ncbi:Secretory carrier-associated membrane protein 5 [Batrachochytrium dendrobatidis]|nr:Secretory carrier-associated membrane protein 5 [Batrachochytrium dendrobatidis]
MAWYAGNSNSAWGSGGSTNYPIQPVQPVQSVPISPPPLPVRSQPQPSPAYSGWSAFLAPEAKPVAQADKELKDDQPSVKETKIVVDKNVKSKQDYCAPNWPRFHPMVYHDISQDIPSQGQGIVRRAFFAWHVTAICYLANFVAATSLFFTKSPIAGATFGISLAVLLLGLPLSFIFWYRRLYFAVKHNTSVGLVVFFFSFLVQNGVIVFLAIMITGGSEFGYSYMQLMFQVYPIPAIMCTVVASLCAFHLLNGVLLLLSVHTHYIGMRAEAQRARHQRR